MGIGTLAKHGPAMTVKTRTTRKAKPVIRAICSCVPEPAPNAACSRCGHVGRNGGTCPHCGLFHPLKSRPELVWWAEVQGKGGAAIEAALTVKIINRLDMYGGGI